MKTFNFEYGHGAVPAHQHANGGGWVADTAHVDESAFIGPDALVYGTAQVFGDARVSGNARVSGDARVSGNAQVYGNAKVSGDAQVYGDAQVSGDARVYGTAWVSGNAWEVSPPYMQCGRFGVTLSGIDTVTIGCQIRTIEDWLERGESIADKNGLTDLEVGMARVFVVMCADIAAARKLDRKE